jgi:hypothetical protein
VTAGGLVPAAARFSLLGVTLYTSGSDLFKTLSDMITPIGCGNVREQIDDKLFSTDLIWTSCLEQGYQASGKQYMYGKIRG